MHINPLDNQPFESKKFRIIVEDQMYTRVGTSILNFKTSTKYVKEYSNPKAEELYIKAEKTSDIKEKVRLYDEMGHYELKKLNIKERLQCVLDKLLRDYLF